MPLEPHGREVSVSEAEQERASPPGVSCRRRAPDGHTWHTLTAKNGEGLRIRPPTSGHQHAPDSAFQRRLGDEHCLARGDRWQCGRP